MTDPSIADPPSPYPRLIAKPAPAGVLVGCVIAHIGFAPLLMFGYGPFPALDPAGAGWGLVIPFGVGSLIMIFYLRSSRSIIHLNFRGQVPRWALFADILKVGAAGLDQHLDYQLVCRGADGHRRPVRPRNCHRLCDGGEARIHHAAHCLWLWNSNRCDGGDELGCAAVLPRSPDRLDRNGDHRGAMWHPGINRRAATRHLAGLIQ
jgi:hypothetical protein